MTPAQEIGELVSRIQELAPAAGLYVGIRIEPAKEPAKSPCPPGDHVSALIGCDPLLIYRCTICGADTSD